MGKKEVVLLPWKTLDHEGEEAGSGLAPQFRNIWSQETRAEDLGLGEETSPA